MSVTTEVFSARYFRRAFQGAGFHQELETFQDLTNLSENLRNLHAKAYLAGGCFRFLYEPKGKINDFDVFFDPNADVELARSFLKSYNYNEIFVCPKGELFSFKKGDVKVQLINVRRYLSIEQLIDTFDITASMFGTDFKQFVYDDRAPTAALTKTIRLNRVDYPVATLNRLMKYMRYGFRIEQNTLDQFVTSVYDMGINQVPLNKRLYVD